MLEETLTVHRDAKPIYDIIISSDFQSLPNALTKLRIQNRRICIVTETNVSKYYLQTVKDIISPCCKEIIDFVFPEGEGNKNLNVVRDLYETLILAKFDRNDMLVALGGGVVGDLTGYAAATYLRGIDFIQIPTSLLAQVDSSIGGKTGVDFDSYKNMVGAFHMPKLVYMNVSVLQTLSDRQFLSGMGEILKHGLIKDSDYFQFLSDNKDKILSRDLQTLAAVIKRSCEIKRAVVENDPTEKGERALLNYGHTLGHAIEKLLGFKLYHGECVGIGSILSTYISGSKSGLSQDEVTKIVSVYNDYGFPSIPEKLDIEEIICTTKNDKKMIAGTIKFILLHDIGNGYIDTSVTDKEMSNSLRTYYQSIVF